MPDGQPFTKLGSIEARLLLGGFVGCFLGLYAPGNGQKATATAYFDRLDYVGADAK